MSGFRHSRTQARLHQTSLILKLPAPLQGLGLIRFFRAPRDNDKKGSPKVESYTYLSGSEHVGPPPNPDRALHLQLALLTISRPSLLAPLAFVGVGRYISHGLGARICGKAVCHNLTPGLPELLVLRIDPDEGRYFIQDLLHLASLAALTLQPLQLLKMKRRRNFTSRCERHYA